MQQGFDIKAPHDLLSLKYVAENDGCTVAEIKKHLGIPLSLSPLPSLIGPANKVHITIATKYLPQLALNGFLTTDARTIRILGCTFVLGVTNSSRMWLTDKGQEALREHGRQVIQLLKCIQANTPCSIKDVRRYWKQICPRPLLFRFDSHEVEILHWIAKQGFVALDGPATRANSAVKLVEKGLAVLEKQPDDVLRLLYG